MALTSPCLLPKIMATGGFNGLLGVEDSKDLLRVYAALRDMPDTLRSLTLSAASQQLAAGWIEELAAQPGYSAATKAVITASPSSVAHSMGLTVATGGTGPLAALTRGFEFGTLNQQEMNQYRRNNSKNSGSHIVTRRTKRQIPSRSTRGWVAYPAAQKWGTRAFRMFQQIIVKVAHDAIDGGK